MSELKVDKVSPRTGNYVSLNTVGMKNIVINGDMSHCTKKHKCSFYNYFWIIIQLIDIKLDLHLHLELGLNLNQLTYQVVKVLLHSLKMDCTTADASPASSR
jgi:hypothetical protein